MKIITVLGARPQFIKAAAVSRIIKKTRGLSEKLVHTGQHYDANMSDIFFNELEIPKPAYHLGIGSGSHGFQTGRMIEAIEKVFLKEIPDQVLVYGDTNSTLAGALAAIKLHIPVAHVEAGLRSFNRQMPEEHNRILTDHCADLLFAPTQTAVHNLKKEGISSKRIIRSGDVMFDAALFFGDKAAKKSRILDILKIRSKQYILATVHRAENTDNPIRLKAIFEGLANVSQHVTVVLPLHPRTRKHIQRLISFRQFKLQIIDPVGYLDMVMLEKNAQLIATDSGGVQKEAFFYKVPCVTLRDETEWVELVDLGWNFIVKPLGVDIVSKGILAALDKHGKSHQPYGKGDAALRIVTKLCE